MGTSIPAHPEPVEGPSRAHTLTLTTGCFDKLSMSGSGLNFAQLALIDEIEPDAGSRPPGPRGRLGQAGESGGEHLRGQRRFGAMSRRGLRCQHHSAEQGQCRRIDQTPEFKTSSTQSHARCVAAHLLPAGEQSGLANMVYAWVTPSSPTSRHRPAAPRR
jgi:hypothetical protein